MKMDITWMVEFYQVKIWLMSILVGLTNIQSFQLRMALVKMTGAVGLCSPREKGIAFKLLVMIYLLLNPKG